MLLTTRHSGGELSNEVDENEFSGAHKKNSTSVTLHQTGKPCIALGSYAAARRTNKNNLERWIKATNGCGQDIRVQVCYHNTEDCTLMNVPPWESKNAVFGIYPNKREFRYDAKEK